MSVEDGPVYGAEVGSALVAMGTPGGEGKLQRADLLLTCQLVRPLTLAPLLFCS